MNDEEQGQERWWPAPSDSPGDAIRGPQDRPPAQDAVDPGPARSPAGFPPAGQGPARYGYGPPERGPADYGPTGYGPAAPGAAEHGPAGHGAAGYAPAGQSPVGWPEYGPARGPQDVVQGQQPRRGRPRLLWAAVAAGTAVVLTAGGVYAYSALSGGSTVLPARVPGDAVGYLEVNLDPPAAQKVAAIRFLRKFPTAKTGAEDGSLLDSVVEPLIEDPEARRLFVENVRPWLGEHVAVVGDPQDGAVQPVLVAETTDPGATRDGMEEILAQEFDPEDQLHYAIVGDVVYLAETQAVADTAARDAGSAALDSNETFSADVDSVGDDGIVTFWGDLARAAALDPSGDAAGDGRVAGSLRFTDSTADLVVHTFDNAAGTGSELVGERVGSLPADTAVGLAVSGADDLIRSGYEQLEKGGLGEQLSEVEDDLGLQLPEDVAALVGTSTVMAMGGSSDQPGFGLVSKTDDVETAKQAAAALRRKLDGIGDVTVRSTADGVVLASSAAYADALGGSGALSEQDAFRAALPDLHSATAVLYVDLRRLAALNDEELPEEAGSVHAFGLTASTEGAETMIRIRLTAD